MLAGAESFVDIARFGDRKLDLLRRLRPFRDGTPSHDQLGDIFATLDAAHFQRCFVAWVAALTGAPAEVIAIDGKNSRRSYQKSRSYQKKGAKAPIHMVSAFAARQRLVLGQVKVAEKSNEIVAIPKLLNLMAIEWAIVTIDAMGCQRDIAQQIVGKKADYVLALKGNQSSLREDVELFVKEQKARSFADTISQDTTVDGDHGRIEARTTTVIHDVAWLQKRHHWRGLKGIVSLEFLSPEWDRLHSGAYLLPLRGRVGYQGSSGREVSPAGGGPRRSMPSAKLACLLPFREPEQVG